MQTSSLALYNSVTAVSFQCLLQNVVRFPPLLTTSRCLIQMTAHFICWISTVKDQTLSYPNRETAWFSRHHRHYHQPLYGCTKVLYNPALPAYANFLFSAILQDALLQPLYYSYKSTRPTSDFVTSGPKTAALYYTVFLYAGGQAFMLDCKAALQQRKLRVAWMQRLLVS